MVGIKLKLALSLVVTTSLIGCAASSPRADFEENFKRLRFMPSQLSEILGKYEFGRASLELKLGSIFYYEAHSHRVFPGDPIRGYTGSFAISNDTLNLTFEGFVYYGFVTDSSKRKVESDSLYYLPSLREFTRTYTPSLLFRRNDHLYIMPHAAFPSVKDTADFKNLTETVVSLTKFRKRTIGRLLLMKVELDTLGVDIDSYKW